MQSRLAAPPPGAAPDARAPRAARRPGSPGAPTARPGQEEAKNGLRRSEDQRLPLRTRPRRGKLRGENSNVTAHGLDKPTVGTGETKRGKRRSDLFVAAALTYPEEQRRYAHISRAVSQQNVSLFEMFSKIVTE